MTTSSFKIVDPNFQTEARTRTYYRWRADGYDKITAHEIEHHREAIQLADIQPNDRILEVACGTGRATVEMAVRLFPCRPVVMESYVREAFFSEVQRIYRNSYTRSMLLLFGTEIVTAREPE